MTRGRATAPSSLLPAAGHDRGPVSGRHGRPRDHRLVARIEPAGPEHVRAVADLYAAHATGGYATFDVEGLPEAVWEERRRASGPGDVLLVALGDDGVVLGFAWAHPYRPKPAYASTREAAVYVDAAATGRGIGRALYAELLDRAAAPGCIWWSPASPSRTPRARACTSGWGSPGWAP